jgi:hypothetical protein
MVKGIQKVRHVFFPVGNLLSAGQCQNWLKLAKNVIMIDECCKKGRAFTDQ